MIADDHLPPELSLSLVHEELGYIHTDFKDIIHRAGNTLFDNNDNDNNNNDKNVNNDRRRLPLDLIMNSGLEDYFEDVLLSDRFKKKLCDECAKRGQLESLKWARSKGCPWTQPGYFIWRSSSAIAAEAGHLHILQWAHANGCRWDWSTCASAAEAGHLHILQ